MSGFRLFLKRFSQNRAAVAGLIVLVLVIAMAAFGPLLYPLDPFEMIDQPSLPPLDGYLLGTDVSGRDILAGVLHGARVSLLIGILASACATLIGIAIGAVAGYYGGVLDTLLMRATDFFLTIPSFVFTVVVVAIFSPTVTNVIFAIALVSWPSVARLARAEFLSQRSRDYVQACKVIGMRDGRIIIRQILPNALPPIIVVASLMVATAILTEAGLSFLGLSDPNVMSWGYMIGVARTVLRTAWWMAAIPGVLILVTVLAISLVGEGLNDALNPRLHRR
jgi:peptide/nickel transport system permease protein